MVEVIKQVRRHGGRHASARSARSARSAMWLRAACAVVLAAACLSGLVLAATRVCASGTSSSPPFVRAWLQPAYYRHSVTFTMTVTTTPLQPADEPERTAADSAAIFRKDPGIFWSNQFGMVDLTNGTTPSSGYFGVQANSLVVFSMWNGRGCRADTARGDVCIPFDENGTGYSVRTTLAWRAGDVLALTIVSDQDGWWRATIQDRRSGVTVPVGQILAPEPGLALRPDLSWIEWYRYDPADLCGPTAVNAGMRLGGVHGDDSTTSQYKRLETQSCGQAYDATSTPDGGALVGAFPQGRPVIVPPTTSQSRSPSPPHTPSPPATSQSRSPSPSHTPSPSAAPASSAGPAVPPAPAGRASSAAPGPSSVRSDPADVSVALPVVRSSAQRASASPVAEPAFPEIPQETSAPASSSWPTATGSTTPMVPQAEFAGRGCG